MYPQQVHSYLQQFFTENNCYILGDSDHYITVQLTIDMDKKIMNRPFYWQYVEATNGEPNPAQVTFITDQNRLEEKILGEVIYFGSPRLSQLFQATKELGAFVQMFEKVERFETKPLLTPWLGVNYKVSYCSDQTKEMLYSFGINLMTGEVTEDFQETLTDMDLDSVNSEDAFQVQYIIKPIRALQRLDAIVEDLIQKDDHTWAEEAGRRWQRSQRVLEYFYEGVEQKPECYEIEKKALEEQYDAKIKIEIINGGLFYLT
ncbi:YqhG family protein [Lysinibacillus sp. NPDC097287]|uniref:YqhG family protein n=1 Tax=Lysinibacillus sp. NPDC097287 TaxID=3364144 RepID=UPI0037F8CF4C